MRIFKNKSFHRFAKKEDITDSELKETVKLLESGQYYADLGGFVYKMELARKGEGKHGGFRTIVVFKSEFRTFFLFGFPKSEMSNIGEKTLKAYKEQAKNILSMSDENIKYLLKIKNLMEIKQEEKNEIRK